MKRPSALRTPRTDVAAENADPADDDQGDEPKPSPKKKAAKSSPKKPAKRPAGKDEVEGQIDLAFLIVENSTCFCFWNFLFCLKV